jgi:hypothetical protein
MQFKDKKDLKEEVEVFGLMAISKFSSIRALAKMGLPLDAMLKLESIIKQVECTMWSILPLAFEGEKEVEKYDSQVKHLNDLLTSFEKALEVIPPIMKEEK